MKRTTFILALLYLIGLLACWGLIRFDAYGWWPVTLFLFSPRWTVALPLLVLIPLTVAFRPRSEGRNWLDGSGQYKVT